MTFLSLLREFVEREPFEPFSLRLMDGSFILLRFQDSITLGEDWLYYADQHGDWVHVRYSAILSIESLVPDYPTRSNSADSH